VAKNQEKLKELLRNVLPLLEEFIGEKMEEDEEPFGRSDNDIEEDFLDDGYTEDVELGEKETDEKYDNYIDGDSASDDKELIKKMSVASISKKLGKDKKRN